MIGILAKILMQVITAIPPAWIVQLMLEIEKARRDTVDIAKQNPDAQAALADLLKPKTETRP